MALLHRFISSAQYDSMLISQYNDSVSYPIMYVDAKTTIHSMYLVAEYEILLKVPKYS